MLIIKTDNISIEAALKKFRKKVESTKQLNELRKRKEYEKPSVKRRKSMQKAKYLNTKNGNS